MSTLKQLDSMLDQIFISKLLFKTSWLKLLNFKVYYYKAELQRELVMLAFTRITFLKITKL